METSEAPHTVVENTPNGREIRQEHATGDYLVQPRNDNYWIRCKTLEDARDAFNNPARYR